MDTRFLHTIKLCAAAQALQVISLLSPFFITDSGNSNANPLIAKINVQHIQLQLPIPIHMRW